MEARHPRQTPFVYSSVPSPALELQLSHVACGHVRTCRFSCWFCSCQCDRYLHCKVMSEVLRLTQILKDTCSRGDTDVQNTDPGAQLQASGDQTQKRCVPALYEGLSLYAIGEQSKWSRQVSLTLLSPDAHADKAKTAAIASGEALTSAFVEAVDSQVSKVDLKCSAVQYV